jgi:hypothetical protein
VIVTFPKSDASNGLIDTMVGDMYVKLLVRNESVFTPKLSSDEWCTIKERPSPAGVTHETDVVLVHNVALQLEAAI